MDGPGFRNYYLNSTRVGSQTDLNYFYDAWYTVYGKVFNYSKPWQASAPEYRVPKVCTKLKTAMLSDGCDSTSAARVLNSFKKWYKDTYE